MSKNPHFYPEIKNYSKDICIKPWAFTQPLSKLEKLEDLQHRVTHRWESQQRQPPHHDSRNKTHVIHTLVDDGDRVIFKSSHGDYYKNIGNIWKTKGDVTILKGMRDHIQNRSDHSLMALDVCGTLEPVHAIQNNIRKSHLCQHVSDVPKPVDIMRIWEERKVASIKELILHLETEVISAPTAQTQVAVPVPPNPPPAEHIAEPAQPPIEPIFIAADVPVAPAPTSSGSEFTASVPPEPLGAIRTNSTATTSTAATSATYGNASTFSNTLSASSATLPVTASRVSIVTADTLSTSGTFALNNVSFSPSMKPPPVEKKKKSWVRRVKDWATGK